MVAHNEATREKCPICGDPYSNLYDTVPSDADSDDVCRGDDGVYVHEEE